MINSVVHGAVPAGDCTYPGDERLVQVFDWGTANNNGNLNVATTSHGIPGNPFLTYKDYYFYDSVNRISNVSGTDDHENLLWLENFQYDRYGNAWTPDMLGLGISGITPRTNVFTDGNQFSMGSRDAAGNQVVVGSYHLTYDAENRQTKVEDQGTLSNGSTFYQYDANGQRVAKARDTGLTIYVYDAFGKLTSEYTNFPVGTPPCGTCYLSQDHLGNTRLVTDQAGNTVARHDYRPFGEELIAGDGFRGAEWGKYDGVKQKFTGQEHDGETQFDFFHARYLSGAQQRFMSPDFSGLDQDPFNPQSWNLYSYVHNNPLNSTDPTGNETCADGSEADACVPGGSPDPAPIDWCWYFTCGGGRSLGDPIQQQPEQPPLPPRVYRLILGSQATPAKNTCPGKIMQSVYNLALNTAFPDSMALARWTAAKSRGTAFFGASASAAAGLPGFSSVGRAMTGQAVIAVDAKGNVGFLLSGGVGLGAGDGLAAGVDVGVSRAPTIFDMAGPSLSVGFGGGDGLGGAVQVSNNGGGTVTGTAGIGVGGFGMGGTYGPTKVVPLVCR